MYLSTTLWGLEIDIGVAGETACLRRRRTTVLYEFDFLPGLIILPADIFNTSMMTSSIQNTWLQNVRMAHGDQGRGS